MASRRPLDSLATVFAGFVFLALLSQFSAHVLGLAILVYYPGGTAGLSSVQQVSQTLAVSAGALGLIFGASILFVTRKKIAREVGVYIAAGLPFAASLKLVLSYHPVRPLAWVTAAAVLAALVDAALGLDAIVPLALGLSFAVLLLAWLSASTFRTYSLGWFRREGRSG